MAFANLLLNIQEPGGLLSCCFPNVVVTLEHHKWMAAGPGECSARSAELRECDASAWSRVGE